VFTKLIPRNTVIPTKKSQMSVTFSHHCRSCHSLLSQLFDCCR
jgi:molecular chaperone DnaK (HSP70)